MTQEHRTTRAISGAWALIAALLIALSPVVAGCAADDSDAGLASDSGGPQPEPPGMGAPGGDFGNPDAQGPGLEPPGGPPVGAAGMGAFDDGAGQGADAGVQDGVEPLPPGVEPARPRAQPQPEAVAPAGPTEPADRGTALRDPLPDGGIPDGWDEVLGDDSAGDDADAGM